MAKNYVQEGDVIDYTTGADAVASGAVVVMGKRVGIALANIPPFSTGSVSVTGVWNQNKLASDVVALGDELYWDDVNDRLTKTAGSNVPAGFAFTSAGAGATAVNVKINA